MSSAPFVYYVACGINRHILKLQNKRVNSVNDAIRTKFGISPSELFVLQVEDEVDFPGMWVDVDISGDVAQQMYDLPDRAKLNVVKVIKSMEKIKNKDEIVSAAVILSTDVTQCDLEELTDVDDPFITAEEAQPAATSSTDFLPWPYVYKLPPFPRGLLRSLVEAKSSADLTRSSQSYVIRLLYDHIVQYTLYPKAQQYRAVCSTLVKRFPNLQDRVTHFGRQKRSAHLTWLTSLKQKFKKERQKQSGDQSVLDMRARYGVKGPHRSRTPHLSDKPTLDKFRHSEMRISNTDELQRSIEEHRCSMTKLVRSGSAVVTPAVLDTSMLCTFNDRRELVSQVTIAEVVKLYPALRLASQLQKEFERMTKINIKRQLQTFLSGARVNALLNILRAKKHNIVTAEYLERIGRITEEEIESQKMFCSLLLLPAVFDENVENWMAVNEVSVVVSPIIMITVPDDDSIFQPINTNITVRLDNITIASCDDIFQATIAALSLYWVFDIAYPIGLRKTLEFLAGHVCGIQSCNYQPTASVQRVINKLYR